MTTKYLLPYIYKEIGWIASIPFILLSLYFLIFEISISNDNIFKSGSYGFDIDTLFFGNLCIIGLTVTLCLIAFSREQDEDEYIGKIRCESLIWATIVNYAILIIAALLLYEFDFLTFMFVNMFTLLILFIAKFNVALYRLRHEK